MYALVDENQMIRVLELPAEYSGATVALIFHDLYSALKFQNEIVLPEKNKDVVLSWKPVEISINSSS